MGVEMCAPQKGRGLLLIRHFHQGGPFQIILSSWGFVAIFLFVTLCFDDVDTSAAAGGMRKIPTCTLNL